MELFTPAHLLIVFLLSMLFFGAKRLPELGRGVGEGIRSMRDVLRSKDNPPSVNPSAPKK